MEGAFLLPWAFYILLGGSFTLGQAVSTEIGRYELWSRERRFLASSFIGAALILLALALAALFSIPLKGYPLVLLSSTACAKLGARAANASCGARFQPTEEELRARYSLQFAIEEEEVTALLEDDFTKRLWSSLGGAPTAGPATTLVEAPEIDPEHLEEVSETELKRAIERFIDEWRRRWAKRYGSKDA